MTGSIYCDDDFLPSYVHFYDSAPLILTLNSWN